jgi:hypothetical protein
MNVVVPTNQVGGEIQKQKLYNYTSLLIRPTHQSANREIKEGQGARVGRF